MDKIFLLIAVSFPVDGEARTTLFLHDFADIAVARKSISEKGGDVRFAFQGRQLDVSNPQATGGDEYKFFVSYVAAFDPEGRHQELRLEQYKTLAQAQERLKAAAATFKRFDNARLYQGADFTFK